MLKLPVAVVNLKGYPTAIGRNALALSKTIERVAAEHGVSAAVAVQPLDVAPVAQAVGIPVLAQHVDAVSPGSVTGWVLPETLVDAGAAGSLVNHSEHRLKLADIDLVVTRLRALRLCSLVCTNNPATSAAAAALRPDMVAVEPPELIGSGISVSKARPEVVSGSVGLVKGIARDVAVLCGAGISGREDVAKAVELGSEGVLLASYITTAKDPAKAMAEIARGLGGA